MDCISRAMRSSSDRGVAASVQAPAKPGREADEGPSDFERDNGDGDPRRDVVWGHGLRSLRFVRAHCLNRSVRSMNTAPPIHGMR